MSTDFEYYIETGECYCHLIKKYVFCNSVVNYNGCASEKKDDHLNTILFCENCKHTCKECGYMSHKYMQTECLVEYCEKNANILYITQLIMISDIYVILMMLKNTLQCWWPVRN